VTELVSQLSTYKRYFDRPKNAAWAKEHLGVQTSEPRLFGLIGNFDSFDNDEVALASDPYKDNVVVMSYAALIDLLRARQGGTSVKSPAQPNPSSVRDSGPT
jgi:hypothetical protein